MNLKKNNSNDIVIKQYYKISDNLIDHIDYQI